MATLYGVRHYVLSKLKKILDKSHFGNVKSYTMKWKQILYLSSDFHFIIMHNTVNCKRVVSMEGQFVTNTEHITAFTLTWI
jgi:hypothetical protein